MKVVFLLGFILFVFSTCYSQSDSLPIFVFIKVDSEYVKAYSKKGKYIKDLIRRNNYVVKSDSIKEKFYDITMAVKNNSDSVIAITLMTCSVSDNFIVNNKYMHIVGEECDNNFPTSVEFRPGESKLFKTRISKSMDFDYGRDGGTGFPQVETTKLGLIIVDDIFERKSYLFDYLIDMEDRSAWKIVWSNSLYLLNEKEAHPEPLRYDVYQKPRKEL